MDKYGNQYSFSLTYTLAWHSSPRPVHHYIAATATTPSKN